MRNFISDYFGFNRQQRNGLWVLLLISFTLLLVRLLYPYFITPDPIVIRNLPLVEQKIDSAFQAKKSYHTKEGQAVAYAPPALFAFDPNTVSLEQLLQLGFREKTATTFLKFRSRGFVFKEKEDLKKVYGISDRFYQQLAPYVVISKTSAAAPIASAEPVKPITPKAFPVAEKLELNTADSAALVSLKGLGPVYTQRIMKYRRLLGGFVSAQQLREVYGLHEALIADLMPQLTVNATLVRKLHVNSEDFKTLNRHPYLGYELTKSIFNARRQVPLSAERLKEVLNDEALYQKLMPYLAFD